MTVQTQAPTARQVEERCAAEMLLARQRGREADGERAKAHNAFVIAERDRDAAVDAGVRGDADADERLSAALSAVREAAGRVVEAEALSASARRVHLQAEARQRQVRSSCIDELADEAKGLVDEVVRLRDALAEPLRAYVNAYGAAASRWRELRSGAYAKVEALDAERGYDRDPDKLTREASCPACPIDSSVVGKLLAVVPRPPVLSPNYEPDAAPEHYSTVPEPTGPTPLFAGDEGYQEFTLGVEDAPPPGSPIGWREPPSRGELLKAQFDRVR
jgi:hypothetical protein